MSIWTTNSTLLLWIREESPSGRPAGSYGGLGFPPPFDAAPYDTLSTDSLGMYWASSTKDAAVQKFLALQYAWTEGSPNNDFNEVSNGETALFVDTGALNFYTTTPEQITPSGSVPGYILSVWRFKASSLADFSDEGSIAGVGSTFYYYVYEIDDSYNPVLTSLEYDAYNLQDIGNWQDQDYLWCPAICFVTDSPDGQAFGDYIPNTAVPTVNQTQPSAYVGPAPSVAVSNTFELAWNPNTRWYPKPNDPVAPAKYNGGVNYIKVEFGTGPTRYAVIAPTQESGFMIYETDSSWNPLNIVRVFRNDRTFAAIIDKSQLNAYLPKLPT